MKPSHDRSRREDLCVPERIRIWGLQFDGYSDHLAFIEQVEGRALFYGIDLELLPRAMAELLTSRADMWFQTSRLQGADWITLRREFLEFFLPPRYLQRLDDQIRSREQLERETFKDLQFSCSMRATTKPKSWIVYTKMSRQNIRCITDVASSGPLGNWPSWPLSSRPSRSGESREITTTTPLKMRQLIAPPHRVGLNLRSLKEFPKETHHAHRQNPELPRQLGLTV